MTRAALCVLLCGCGAAPADYSCQDMAAEACYLMDACDARPAACFDGWCATVPDEVCRPLLESVLGCRHAPPDVGACLDVNVPLISCEPMAVPNGCRW